MRASTWTRTCQALALHLAAGWTLAACGGSELDLAGTLAVAAAPGQVASAADWPSHEPAAAAATAARAAVTAASAATSGQAQLAAAPLNEVEATFEALARLGGGHDATTATPLAATSPSSPPPPSSPVAGLIEDPP